MDIKDVLKDIGDISDYRLERRLNDMINHNPSYNNLDHKNRDLVFDLLKKYKKKVKRGIKISSFSIHRDMYYLYKHRIKLGLSKYDLDMIKKILNSFKTI